MYLVDYHIHTDTSGDGESPIEQMVLAAIEKNVKEIAITDHLEIGYPPVDYECGGVEDQETYMSGIAAAAEKFKDSIRVVTGVEIGLQSRVKKEIDEFFDWDAFDFIIGSTHAVDYKDLYDGSFFEGKTRKEAYDGYFDDVYNTVKNFDMFHVLGHLDSVIRYVTPKEEFVYSDYREAVDEILKLIIKKGKGIEVNSSGYRYGFSSPHPCFDILKRYKELGGEIITIASDAHRPADVASYSGELYKMLEEAGFKAITTFYGGKPVNVDMYRGTRL